MKNKITLLMAIVALFGACQNNDKVAIDKAAIHVKITNATYSVAYIMEDYNTTKDTLKIVDGIINQKITVNKSRPYTFKVGNQITNLYITPGDSISFDVDYKKFDESIIFSASAKDENALLLKLAMSRTRPKYFMDARKQLAYLDSTSASKVKMIDEFAENHPSINPKFVEQQKMISYYYSADKKISYPWLIKYKKKKDPENLDDSFFTGIDTLQLENPDLVYYWEYLAYVNSYLKKTQKDKGIKFKSMSLEFPQFIVDTIESQPVQDYLMTRNILLSYATDEKRDSLMDFLNKNVKTKEVLSKFQNEYKKLIGLKKGIPAPMWTAKDKNGNKHSLNDFKGKWVYLDVWASWCQPCVMEIPHMKKMEENLKGKNIAFVSISIDNNSDNWKKALEKYELHGYQYIKPESKSKTFMDDYMVRGVPSFYLIDPDGNIYMKNPPRTSEVEKFNALMKGNYSGSMIYPFFFNLEVNLQ